MNCFFKKICAMALLTTLLSAATTRPACAQYSRSYRYYIQLAEEAMDKGSWKEAIFYYETAFTIDPNQDRPKEYINLIKRFSEGRVKKIEPVKKKERGVRESVTADPVVIRPQIRKEKKQPDVSLPPESPTPPLKVLATIKLNDELWKKQPDTPLRIEMNKAYILEGYLLERYLAVTEGVLNVERIDKNRIKISTSRRSSTFFHAWDQRGRWTFFVEGVPALFKLEQQRTSYESLGEAYAEPFKFAYTNSWTTLYNGSSFKEMSKENILFEQWMGTYGTTPYGDFDASINFYKFEESFELVGQRLGLTNGHIGPFRDFMIRGFDTSARFSELSLPGRSFRGWLLDAYAFDRVLKYTAFQGQDRAQFLYISPSVFEERRSYIEGLRMTLFPGKDHEYSLNYARGFGQAREESLKDKVYSFDSKHKLGDFLLYSEVGHDEDTMAKAVGMSREEQDFSFFVNVRDYEEDYQTIIGRPANSGEVGGNVLFTWKPEKIRFRTNLDVYRDREEPNPDYDQGLNLEWDGSVSVPLNEKTTWDSSVFYDYTPQLLSPRQTVSLNNRLSRLFPWFFGKEASFYLGNTYQRNRYDESPGSEYDRYTLMTGTNFPIWKTLGGFVNYDYSWAKDIENSEWGNPHVLRSGLNYSTKITKRLSGNTSLYYRNEENTAGQFSFLSGEDSLRGSLSLTYRPTNDIEIFFDGTADNVWAEEDGKIAFNEAYFHLGMRAAWDAFFCWNPTGFIKGTVYKDINGNGLKEANEPGLGHVEVLAGKKSTTTDSRGEYNLPVKAKKVKVRLKTDSIPSGFVFSSDVSKDVLIEHGQSEVVNFGLTVRSGIYGVVYFDANQNGKPDPGDEMFPGVRLYIDGVWLAKTDFEGTYVFDEIPPGGHTLKIDVNSLPLDYLPLIPLNNQIELEEGTSYMFHIPIKKAGD